MRSLASIFSLLLMCFWMMLPCQAQDLLDYHLSECEKHELDEMRLMQERIIASNLRDNILRSKIAFIGGCELNFDDYEHHISRRNDTLFLSYKRNCEGCPATSCLCYFEIEYSLRLDSAIKTIFFRRKPIQEHPFKYRIVQKEEFEMYRGDTVNHVDQFGFEQGVHIRLDEEERLAEEWIIPSIGHPNYPTKSGLTREFYGNGAVKIERLNVFDDVIWERKYSKKGKIKKEELFDSSLRQTQYLQGMDIKLKYADESALLEQILIYNGEKLVEVIE